MSSKAYLFGYGKLGRILVETLDASSVRFHIIESTAEHCTRAKEDGYSNAMQMDITRDEELETLNVHKDDFLICVMDDEHLNVFLILSLRALFPEVTILAISTSIYGTQKLRMAGATKVIDLYQVSANRIHNILKKPVATKLMDDFLSREEGVSFKEIRLTQDSDLVGRLVHEVDVQPHGLLLVGFIRNQAHQKFTFITGGPHHQLTAGDIIVCIGEWEDLQRFEQHIKDNG